MPTLMKVQEQENAAAGLGNQISAGIAIREAVWRMHKLQPKYAELWIEAAEEVARGKFLSEQLVGWWPEALISSLRAGEESGSIPAVLARIRLALELKRKVNKSFGTLLSPLISGGLGVAVFLFFMIGVIPMLQQGLGGGEASFLFRLSSFMHDTAVNYWPFIAGLCGFTVFAGAHWLSQADNRERVVAWADQVPKLGEAMRMLYFGVWAYYLAVLDTAGLPVKQQLILSSKTLPEVFRDGVLIMASEVEKRGRAEAADPEKQTPDDPRRQWPYYIASAFMNAHETGELDKEMDRVAPILVEEGMRELAKVTAVLDLGAKLLAAVLIAAPMMAYFTQLSYSLTKAFSS